MAKNNVWHSRCQEIFSSTQCRTFRNHHEYNSPIKYESLPYNQTQTNSPCPPAILFLSYNEIISSISTLDRHAFSVGTIFRVLEDSLWSNYTMNFLCLIKNELQGQLELYMTSKHDNLTTSGPSYVVQRMNPSAHKMDSGAIISRPVSLSFLYSEFK